jgi:UDP-glucose 4-epimerase
LSVPIAIEYTRREICVALPSAEDQMIFVTGGAGYIGSHACVELLNAGEDIVVLDNFCNSSPMALERVQKICNKSLIILEGDIRDQAVIERAIVSYGCTAVMHFAGLKSVQDSVAHPLTYYDNNVVGTYRLLRAMQKTGVKKIIFSSSATVYGPPQFLPYTEHHPLNAINPYGKTKLMIEEMLRDQFASDPCWSIGILRYFNPVGAHDSGLIGEDPRGVPGNLFPFVAHVAIGRRERLSVWGGDYNTPDGTGIRDYIHVMDLAAGHIAALRLLGSQNCFVVNLGSGLGSSVLEIVRTFERVTGRQVPYEIRPRRPGDIDAYYAATDYALKLMGWRATRTLDEMCVDHWRWQSNNPSGYG